MYTWLGFSPLTEFKFCKENPMPSYLVQVAYTSEALSTLIAKPQNRAEVVAKTVKKLGGKIKGAWLAFGEYDTIVVVDMPDNVSAAAFALAVGGGGSCKSVRTTPLIDAEEGIAAFKKAGSAGYKPVGAE
jgi:uncharacterized protein with GYD domain